MSEVLVQATRGNLVENIYHGDVVVVQSDGKILLSLGDPEKQTYWRSAAKPFQVLPFIEAGGLEKYQITPKELALMCASHGGEPEHVALVAGLLEKIGFSESDLRCGSAAPMNITAMRKMLKQGETWNQLHNCCSGKHAAMLALAAMKNYDPDHYEVISHPVQQEMLQAISQVTGVVTENIGIGTDGCGVPIYYLPLSAMAYAYAGLSQPKAYKHPTRGIAMGHIAKAMTRHPWFVAGTGRLDTILMEVTQGKLLAKLGADGVYCVSVMGEGIGIALKIESGDVRVIDPLIVKLLYQMGFISDKERAAMEEQFDFNIYNHRKEVIGKMECIQRFSPVVTGEARER